MSETDKKCDICGVEDVLVDIKIGKELNFCPEHFEKLKESGVGKIVREDERQRIIELLEEEIEKLGVAKSEGLRILKSKLSGEEG